MGDYYEDHFYLIPATPQANDMINELTPVGELNPPLNVYVCNQCGCAVIDRGIHNRRCNNGTE